MSTDFSGYWTGKIEGTNSGGVAIELTQEGARISGTAKLSEPSIGEYEYSAQGFAGDGLSLNLTPIRNTSGASLGNVKVVAKIGSDGRLAGRWKSDIGTEGIFYASRFGPDKLAPELPKRNSVFLVHGHDDGAMHAVARFLEQIGLFPVILQEQINRGMTVIEKFEDFAARAGFAVVLMTPDDIGFSTGKDNERKSRPRQNVILELGYFAALLSRSKTFVLVKGDLEMPSDVLGLVYEPMDRSEGWKIKLARELRASGFEVDMNRTLGQ